MDAAVTRIFQSYISVSFVRDLIDGRLNLILIPFVSGPRVNTIESAVSLYLLLLDSRRIKGLVVYRVHLSCRRTRDS